MKLKIGNKLNELREQRRMTQADFAELLSMSQANYSRLERGEVQADFQQLIRFAEVLNVPLQEFLPDTFTFHNHNHNGQGGVVFGNLIVNQGVDETTKTLESEISLLKNTNHHLEQQIALMQEQIELLKQLHKPDDKP